MNSPRDEFFAGAGFAGDQNGRIAAGDLRHLRQDGGQRGRAADNLLEHRGLVDFLSKCNVLLLQFILVSLAILDVGACDVPPDDLALVVPKRVVTNQEPAIRPVAATQALLQLESPGDFQRTVKMCPDPVNVVRMNLGFMPSLTPLVEADAVVGERHSIRIQPLELGPQHADELWREVQHLTELRFLKPDHFFGSLTLGDVGHRPDKLASAGCILYGVRYCVDVLDAPVRQEQAILMFEVGARLGYAIDNLLCEGPIRG